MSQENVERVQAVLANWENGEYSNTDWADPEIEFVMETPGGGTSRGVQAMGDTWRDFLRAWEEFHVQVRKVIDAGDQVLVLHDFGGRGHESGVPISGMQGAALFTLREGRVQRLVLYPEWDAALEAAGLREQAMSRSPRALAAYPVAAQRVVSRLRTRPSAGRNADQPRDRRR